MITARYRQLKQEEQEQLERLIPEPTRWTLSEVLYAFVLFLLGGPVAGMMLAWMLCTLLRPVIPDAACFTLLQTGCVLGFSAGVWAIATRNDHVRKAKRKYLPDIVTGVAEIARYEIRAAVGVEGIDYPECMSGYFLDVGEGLLVYLNSHLDDGGFPTEVIEVTRAPRSGWCLGLSCSGALVPVVQRPPLRYDEYDPKDGEILVGTLDDLSAVLRRIQDARRSC
jgi:hypothetical protein